MCKKKYLRLTLTKKTQCNYLHSSILLFFVCVLFVSLLRAFSEKDTTSFSINEFQDSVIVNSGFEKFTQTNSPVGWTSSADQNNSDASHIVEGGYSGKYALEHRKGTTYKVTTSQTLTSLSDGYYSLWAWVRNSGGQNSCFLAAQTDDIKKITSLPVSKEWKRIVVRGILVKSRKCTISLTSDANANNWCQIDDLQLVKATKPYPFLKGGDISELSYIESMGGKFYDNGVEKDCLQILKDYGFNLIRLRLYNDPGNPDYSPSKRLPTRFSKPKRYINHVKANESHGFPDSSHFLLQ